MASITSTGIGSGLDVNAIVTQLMALESRPLTLLQKTESQLDAQLSAFGKLQSLTSAMRDAANALSSVTLWNQTSASSADATSVAVASAGGATLGSYSVSVNKLAASQTVSSRAWSSSTDTLNGGKLTIELGSWIDEPAPTGFTPKSGASAIEVEIADGDSLATVRDKINSAQAGVTATLVNDASGTRLALRSSATGEANAFRIGVTESSDDGAAAAGLSALAFDAAGATQMVRNASAQNAEATINGIVVSSASNTLDGVADGLTLTLLKPTLPTAPVEVTVAANAESVKTAVTTFTTAFNALASYIRDQTRYDEGSKTGGTLQGDRTTVALLGQLRAVINQPSSASAAFSTLSDVGITMAKDGTLAIDSAKLDGAIAKRSELRKVFATDGADSGTSGFMDRFRDLGNALLGNDGALTTRSEGLETSKERNQRSQDAVQLRLDSTEKRLRAQYQALDTSMSELSSLSSYLSQQLALLNASS